MKEKEVMALISLLEDPDQDVLKTVTVNLISHGADIIPDLEQAWEQAASLSHQERLEEIIHKIQFNHTLSAFRSWIRGGYADLLEGAFLIARFQYPDLNFRDVEDKAEQIRQDVWIELNNNLTALEKIRILNHILFDIHKFTKSTTDFYHPNNSFINKVLEHKQGNPISLSIVYAVVAQRLGLPVYGVNLPRNFILAYRDDMGKDLVYDTQSDDILFYINPFNKGAVHSRREIAYFLGQQKIKAKKNYFLTCTNLEIIERVTNNLINAYQKQDQKEKAEVFRKVRLELIR